MSGVMLPSNPVFPSTSLILSRPVVAVDVETDGLLWWKNHIFGISLSWFNDDKTVGSFYGDIRDPRVKWWMADHLPKLQKVVNHFIKFDVHMLRETGLKIPQNYECTMIRETLLDEHQYEYGLDRLSWKYLNRGKKEIWPELAKIFGGAPTKEVQALNLHRAPYPLVAEYANIDTSNALQVYDMQNAQLLSEDLTVIHAMEMRLLRAVVGMEHGGVPVDLDRAEASVPALTQEINRQQKELDRLVGRPVNANSNPQAKEILGVHQKADGTWWTKDGVRLEPTESGKSGSLKTEKLYQCQLPEARLIAEIRSMIKARDTFLLKYILGMSHNGYVHANINQTRTEEGDGTYTGRFSITEPALQQIHKRNKKMAAVIRACFIPDPRCEWGCYDWSQKDFRMFGHYINDPKINAIFAADPSADFHRTVADITGLPRDRDEKTGGANAKQMNLGLIFGMSAGRMAKEMFLPYTVEGQCPERNCREHTTLPNCPVCGTKVRLYQKAGPEAQALFAKYHDNIPGAEKLKKNVASVAKTRGYILTQLGRRIRFPNPNEAYKAAGILYQGQAAESMKYKICELWDMLQEKPGHRLSLVVHDEFDIMLPLDRDRAVDNEIKDLLQRFDGEKTQLKYRIPILADFGLGPNWWEASK